MKKIFLAIVLVCFCLVNLAQTPVFSDTQIINGFAQKISGEDFSYHSSIPPAKECLLVRATDGNSSLEWQTSPAPEKLENEYVTFVWLAGLGSSPGRARFDLQVNGEDKFSFWADGSNNWELKNEDGSVLSFQKDLIDQHGDRFGFMYLKIPSAKVAKGTPLRLKVTGGKFNKTSWYMTFKFRLETKLSLKSLPAISEINEFKKQLGVLGVLHFEKPAPAKIYIDNQLATETELQFGYNYLRVELPVVSEEKTVSYRLEVGGFTEKGDLTIKPVRNWRVNFVQH